jgi:hypothetical protein
VAASGDFLFNCPATVWYPGMLVAIAENSANNGVQPQTVVATINPLAAIGVAMPLPNAIGQSRTSVAVRIRSALGLGIEAPGTEPSSSGTP